MCAEKVQRLLMAAVVFVAFYLISVMSIFGWILGGFVLVMMVIWAFTDFCPSIAILRLFLPSCYEKKS